jgi:hypothetical protein
MKPFEHTTTIQTMADPKTGRTYLVLVNRIPFKRTKCMRNRLRKSTLNAEFASEPVSSNFHSLIACLTSPVPRIDFQSPLSDFLSSEAFGSSETWLGLPVSVFAALCWRFCN